MNRLSLPSPSAPMALAALLCIPLAGCTQPLHLQYDFGRAYSQSMQVQANLDRPTAVEANYPLAGTEAILIRANVVKEDSSEKTGQVESTDR